MKKRPARNATRGEYRPRHHTFASLAAEGIEIFAKMFPSHAYAPATELFGQGSSADIVYCISRGLVKLSAVDQAGREFIVGLRSPGWILGAASVMVQKPHLVTATTITICHLYPISAGVFLDLAQGNAQFSWYLHRVHSREVYDQVTQLVRLRFSTARERFEQLLLQVIFSMGITNPKRGRRVQFPMKHWEIARLIGVTPEHLSRVLKQMEQEGVINREKGSIVIADFNSLQPLADSQRLGIDLGEEPEQT